MLFTGDHPIINSIVWKDRVKLGADYTLNLSPVQIHDDNLKFSCQVTIRPGKILQSSTMVKVFGKSFYSLISCSCLIFFCFALSKKMNSLTKIAIVCLDTFCLCWGWKHN